MAVETLFALVLFVVLMVGTPGPANILAMAAGAQWGVRRCVPFIIGLTCGKMLLNLLMAFGLLALLTAQPAAAQALRLVSGAYLLWLAWRIAGLRLQKRGDGGEGGADGGGEDGRDATRGPGFTAGVIVHPLNPKAWAMSTSAYAQFTDADNNWLLQSGIILLTFATVQLVFHSLWCVGGATVAARLAGTVFERVLMLVLALSVALLVLATMLEWI